MITTYKGQLYRLLGDNPHTCRDGRETVLGLWEANCADCGQHFVFTVPALAKKFQPNRRCRSCKRPGQRVKEAVQ